MKKGLKLDQEKRNWTLLPFDALEEVVKVLEFGADKYEVDNWKHVKPNSRYLKAAFRHLIDYTKGEKLDPESGCSHLAHCCCCILFLLWEEVK